MEYTEEQCPDCGRISVLSEANDYLCRDCFNDLQKDDLDDWDDWLDSRDQG